MKKVLLVTMLVASMSFQAQTKKATPAVPKTPVTSKATPEVPAPPVVMPTFKFNPDGTAEFCMYQADKLTAAEIYTKTINWINETYKNPDAVIKGKVENEMVRIDGFNDKMFTRTVSSGKVIDYGVKYTMEIQVQDNKFRIKFIHNDFDIKMFFPFTDVVNNIADKNGNAWNGSIGQYEANVQKLMDSLYGYITKPKEKW